MRTHSDRNLPSSDLPIDWSEGKLETRTSNPQGVSCKASLSVKEMGPHGTTMDHLVEPTGTTSTDIPHVDCRFQHCREYTGLILLLSRDLCNQRWLKAWGIDSEYDSFLGIKTSISCWWMILSHGTVGDVAEVSIDFRIRFFVGETHRPREEDGKNID